MDIGPILFLLFVGACTGLLAGLLGIGGGMIMVPFMTLYLDYKGFGPDAIIKVAIATSLASILFTSISSVRAQHLRGSVRWDLVRAMSPGIVLGSLVGSVVAYVANRRHTFESDVPHRTALPRHYAVVAGSIALNALIFRLAHGSLDAPVWLAQGLATGLCMVFNFVASKYWVFKQQ